MLLRKRCVRRDSVDPRIPSSGSPSTMLCDRSMFGSVIDPIESVRTGTKRV
jgi:hypothetical protein